MKKGLGYGIALFLMLTSTLSVFQYASLKKFDVTLIVSMSQSEVYQEKVNVDENTTAAQALSKLMSVTMQNDSIRCVNNVCNEGNNTWVAMTDKGALLDPITHLMATDELVYFIYASPNTDSAESTAKAQKDVSAIKQLLKL